MKMWSMAALAAGAVAALALGAGPAMAYCSKPIAPYCASDGTLSDRHVSRSECRSDVAQHVTGLGRYRACLAEEVRKTDAEIERFRKLIARQDSQAGE